MPYESLATFDKTNFKQGKLMLNNPSATERTFEQLNN